MQKNSNATQRMQRKIRCQKVFNKLIVSHLLLKTFRIGYVHNSECILDEINNNLQNILKAKY